MSIGGKCGVGTGKTMSDTLTVVAEDTSVGWVPLRKLRLDEQNRGASKMETSVTSLDRFQRGRIITHKIQCGQHISIAYRIIGTINSEYRAASNGVAECQRD